MEQVRRIELPSQPWQGRILATEPHLRCLYLYYIKKNLKNQLKLGCDLPFFYGKMFLIKDRRLEMKKKNKILIILLLLLLAGGIGFGVYYFIFKEEPVTLEPTKEVQITNSIENYGYNLDDRDTELFKTKFEELKTLLNEEQFDTEEYVSLISQLFIIDLYTIDNKISRYDVGGLEYVYKDAVASFQSVAQNSIYKTVENNLDDTRTQKLPEVSEIMIDSIKETTFTMPNDSVVNGYGVKLTWDYVESLGYDTHATLILIPDENKYGVVYMD